MARSGEGPGEKLAWMQDSDRLNVGWSTCSGPVQRRELLAWVLEAVKSEGSPTLSAGPATGSPSFTLPVTWPGRFVLGWGLTNQGKGKGCWAGPMDPCENGAAFAAEAFLSPLLASPCCVRVVNWG